MSGRDSVLQAQVFNSTYHHHTSDGLIKTEDDLSKAVKGVIPQKGATMEALEQLVDIFKQQDKEKEDSATRQRVHKENKER